MKIRIMAGIIIAFFLVPVFFAQAQGNFSLFYFLQSLLGGNPIRGIPTNDPLNSSGDVNNNISEKQIIIDRLEVIKGEMFRLGLILNEDGIIIGFTQPLTKKAAKEVKRLQREAHGLSLQLQLIDAQKALAYVKEAVQDAENNRQKAIQERKGKQGMEGFLAESAKQEAMARVREAKNEQRQAEAALREIARAIRKKDAQIKKDKELANIMTTPPSKPLPNQVIIRNFCVEDGLPSDSFDGLYTCADERRKREIVDKISPYSSLTDAEREELERLRIEFYDRWIQRQDEIDRLAEVNRARERRDFCDRYGLTC